MNKKDKNKDDWGWSEWTGFLLVFFCVIFAIYAIIRIECFPIKQKYQQMRGLMGYPEPL